MPTVATQFEDVLISRIVDGIKALRDETGVYAVSLIIWEEENDARRPALNLGYNTTAFFTIKALEARPLRRRAPDEPLLLYGGHASSEGEAKWNPAVWKNQWFREIKGDGEPPDVLLAQAREAWLRATGLWIDDDQIDARLDEALETKNDDVLEPLCRMTEEFFAVCVRIVRRLHDDGHVERTFGKPIPVLLVNHDFGDAPTELTYQANPPGLVDEYCAYMRSPLDDR